ncbi:ArgK/MeaB family GTPase [uncultured Amaricoccus sp.]|uniref:ArgK/MeaB family GTPase n=2 Tax=Amaricoccus TaxID=56999 RepID=UPI0026022BC8|nr:ATP/GTP-binding protein [uncultured Amaricoccus sp.]
MKPLPSDLGALRAGGKAALARALSALETAPEDAGLVALLDAAFVRPGGLVLGLTGPPGVGKSTLINAMLARLRARGTSVGVIAVDPSSRRSGGALLGDRTRIETDPEDAGVFVRSMAARRRLGGLADLTFPASMLMRACFDWVIIETVGVGQSEMEITDCADLVVFCAQPGSGDALQFMKAGVMEIPDVVLVTKGDTGAPARRAAADVKGALSLAAEDRPPAAVAIVSAMSGEGLDEALTIIAACAADPAAELDLAARRRAQGRAWAESRLVESFGREGLAALAPRGLAVESPFATVARLSRVARQALHQSLENI